MSGVTEVRSGLRSRLATSMPRPSEFRQIPSLPRRIDEEASGGGRTAARMRRRHRRRTGIDTAPSGEPEDLPNDSRRGDAASAGLRHVPAG